MDTIKLDLWQVVTLQSHNIFRGSVIERYLNHYISRWIIYYTFLFNRYQKSLSWNREDIRSISTRICPTGATYSYHQQGLVWFLHLRLTLIQVPSQFFLWNWVLYCQRGKCHMNEKELYRQKNILYHSSTSDHMIEYLKNLLNIKWKGPYWSTII